MSTDDVKYRPPQVELRTGVRGANLIIHQARFSQVLENPWVLTRTERGENLPLSFAQQRLWFLGQMEGGSEAYHMPLRMRMRGALDAGALRRALDRIVARHEVLRTTFVVVKGEPVQRIQAAEQARFELREEDLRERGERSGELARRIEEETERAFDLTKGPLIRGQLLRVAEDEHVLLITVHHIVSDEWSMGIFLNELNTLYGAFCQGQADPLPELELQYADYAVWQRQWMEGDRISQAQARYWKENLAGAPALLELPWDHARPAQQNHGGGLSPFELEESLLIGLKALGRRHGATLFMTLLGGWAALMGRLSGQEEVVIGVPVANRGRTETRNLIGLFVNTLAVPVNVSGGETVRELLEQTKRQALAAQQHQDIPFEQVVELVNPPRSLAHSPLFQVMFAWQNAPEGRLEFPGVEIEALHAGSVKATFDLTLSLQETSGRITGEVEYATSLFEAKTVARYLGYFRRLLEGMVVDEGQRLDQLSMLSETERQQLLNELNDTAVGYPHEKCVHQLFEEQVEKTPEAIAVVYEDQVLSYGELNRRANQLAHYLRKMGVKPDTRVGICVERGMEMMIGLLGILKAGGAYVPLDPGYPAERLRFMLEDSGPVVVLTQAHLRTLFPGVTSGLPFVDLRDAEDWRNGPENNLEPIDLTSQHLAYVIYTSGSTGLPKGVMVEHRAVSNRITALRSQYQVCAQDRLLQFASINFDQSVEEMFCAVLSGATLVLRTDAWLVDAKEFWALCARNSISILDLPTRFWQQILDDGSVTIPEGVRLAIIGGEAVDYRTLSTWFKRKNYKPKLLNTYGPTEATIVASVHEVTVDDSHWQSIGRPIVNSCIYILDKHGEPVPVGVVGELYIGGCGVARGYLNRPGLTAERFVVDPFSGEAWSRMYKTGDVGRWLPDRTIEFVGRNDFQVKVRGFRIELGEIEARLVEHGGVKEAVVMVREDTPGDKRLVAYYTETPALNHSDAEAKELRAFLQGSLPEYMVPAAYVRLESLPLTPNGKLDRKRLPAPDSDDYARQRYEAPQGEMERVLAGIWCEVLKLEEVGRYDNFFELGGHSLLAIRLIERMRRQGLRADVRAVFAAPTLAGLAATIVGDKKEIEVPPNRIPAGCSRIRPEMVTLIELTEEEIERVVGRVPGGAENVQDIYPLAPLQEGILFHHLMGGEGDPYVLGSLFSFERREELDRYVAALEALIERHDLLRTAVLWEGMREPVQVVVRKAVLRVEEVELDSGGGDAGLQLYERFNPRRYRMDVGQAPMLRLYISYDKENGRWLMMELMHHLIGDHTNQEVMQEEIEAHLLGQEGGLSWPVPFRNQIAQVRLGISAEEHESYFRKMLGDIDEVTAAFGVVEVQGDGRGIEEATMMVEESVSERVREQARRLGVTPASVWHVAWGRVLGVVSGRRDVVFGTVLFGRLQGGEEAGRAMGMFINTLPMRMEVGEEGAEGSVRGMHVQLAELMRHEHASLALAQRCSGVPAPSPLFTALLNYRHISGAGQTGSAEKARAREGKQWLYGEERTNYPLALSVDDLGQGFRLTAQTQAGIGAKRVCEYMKRAVESLVGSLEMEPGRALRTLEVLPERELEQVLFEWNDTEAKYPKDKFIQELFEEQVEKTPDAVAIACGDENLTYLELNRRANQLAHYLRELGVRPDVPVAICVERGLEMMVGLLAVFKAGGTYVPLAPAYPLERLRFMLADSEPVLLLTQSHLAARFPELLLTMSVLDLNNDETAWKDSPDSNPSPDNIGLTPNHLAYVIYTSGSTGTPKGVMVEHRGVINIVTAAVTKFKVGPEARVLQLSSSSFDASLMEMLMTWIAGGVLVIPHPGLVVGESLHELLSEKQVSHAVIPPSVLKSLSGNRPLNNLQMLIVGAEACTAELVERWAEGRRMVNAYGPTEATICTTASGPMQQKAKIHIGRPIANTQVYILGADGQPVPVGVAGELYIGGAGIARGYLKRPELTAERFVGDPFSGDGSRMYKTGDLGRWLDEGNIECLGRSDFQVKLRGFRVELGEIESRLAEYPEVREAVVAVREDTAGDKRLVAYYTTVPGGDAEQEALEAERLRSYLLASLPEYMVPAAYVRLESLPLTPNGKLDRKALPAPDRDAYAMSGYEEPQGETETTLAAIWAELLKLERVGRQDNFFQLGGHSLLATQVIARLRNVLQVEIPLQALFENQTLASLAAVIEKARTGDAALEQKRKVEKIERQERSEGMPLSFHEQGIYVMARHSPAYRILGPKMATRLQGELNLRALERSLQEIVERHEILRTRYGMKNGREVRILDTAWEVRAVPTEIGGVEREEQVRQAVIQEQSKPFDLERGPLLRINLWKLDEQKHVLLLNMHHIITDGWSMSILSRELQTLYAGHVAGRRARLPTLKIQYADYAVWQRDKLRGEVFNRLLGYWMKRLGGVKNLARLPGDRLPVVSPSLREEHFAFVIGKEATERIRALSRKQGVTPFIILLAIFKLWLYQNTAARDIAVAVPVSERNLVELEDVVGLLINMVVLHTQVREDLNFEEFLRQLHGVSQEAFAHQALPFGIVHQALGNSDFSRVMFDYINVPDYELKLPGLKADPFYSRGNSASSWDVILVLREKSQSIDCLLTFEADLFSKERVAELSEQLKNLILQVLQAPQQRLGQYSQTPVYDCAQI